MQYMYIMISVYVHHDSVMCVCECVPQVNCAELVVYVADMVQSKCHHKRKKK